MQRNRVEMGSSLKEQDIGEWEVEEHKELSYKRFKLRDHKVRTSNGEFRCPFCACKDDDDYGYTNLLQHAIRVAEGSIRREQRAKHSAMARYLAVDLANEVQAEPQQYSDEEWVRPTPTKRSRSGPAKNNSRGKAVRTPVRRQPRASVNAQKVAMAEKREKDALDEVGALEIKITEMTDQMNALITKERSSNDELQGVRTELMKGLSDIQRSSHVHIGIKKIGELDPDVFINEFVQRMPPGDIVIRGVEYCTLWQEKIKDPQWYPFQIIEDDNGKPQRLLKEDDLTLQSLKEELGKEIHDAVVDALTELQEYNPSGCYMVPELWNFREKRKASLAEVIRLIFELPALKAKPRTPRKSRKG
ncbi:factor of DNA methylation 1-like [Salvia miltiorrhiza]|uniref:factor of DNA methylation 1-like n=1 Tax=Salvia miltiorrhiza TaxID=226208 RepID=UPI0025AC66B8|nr:factor of DNA methylation 1-like [Salvia miltiorrhiza]XP_057787853.1 factor of DNA methylation 1-like [Salvia miltiorrhiza]